MKSLQQQKAFDCLTVWLPTACLSACIINKEMLKGVEAAGPMGLLKEYTLTIYKGVRFVYTALKSLSSPNDGFMSAGFHLGYLFLGNC